jgi:uncharacterized ferredoxin-like protein
MSAVCIEQEVLAEEEEEALAADDEEKSNDSGSAFDRRDNACVRTAEDSHGAGCN